MLLHVVVFVAFFLQGDGLNIPRKETIHHRMTRSELKSIFGVESHENVPEYEVTTPSHDREEEILTFQLNKETRRQRRSVPSSDSFFYKFSVFGMHLHLNLTENRNLLAPKAHIQSRADDGTLVKSPIPEMTFYQGNVISDPNSLVALTDFNGLTGMIHTLSDTLGVHPVPDHLAGEWKQENNDVPHIVYRQKPLDTKACATAKHNIIRRNAPGEEEMDEEAEADSEHSDHEKTGKIKYLETLIVSDNKMADVYGAPFLPAYLLLLSNIVASIFQDSSIGENKITFVVNRIVIESEENLGVKPGDGNAARLTAIENWVKNYNTPDEHGGLLFDVTAYIYRGGGGGMASIGTICSSRKAAGVIDDVGLQTAQTIAHELGHVLAIPHDKGKRGESQCPDRTYIMSSTPASGTAAQRWSSCSRQAIQKFLNGPRSSCLNNLPPSVQPTLSPDISNKLPGQIEDADKQCRLQFGVEYEQCPVKKSQCGALYCTKGDSSCVSKSSPPADGTRCGTRNWCIQGECVDDGSPLIDGGWSGWSDYHVCTKTCGGGVRFRIRSCTHPPPQNGGEYCVGAARGDFESCNMQLCPDEKSDRITQCRSKNAELTPWYGGKDLCKLQCVTSELHLYSYDNVKDGTRCRRDPDVKDVCINGKCTVVGCNDLLHSTAVSDRCGICQSDGNQCQLVKQEYTKHHKKRGKPNADVMFTAPIGATRIQVKKRKPTYNVIGVQNAEGKWIVPAEGSFYSQTQRYAGTKVIYDKEDTRYLDHITVPGPITEPLNFMFARIYEKNQGVDFSYYKSLEKGETQFISNVDEGLFLWHIGQWSECSLTCSGGVEKREVYCYRSDDNTTVGDWACGTETIPESIRPCNTQPCPAQWHVTEWTPCSKTCGKGVQTKSVLCRATVKVGQIQTLNDTACVEKKPVVSPLSRFCNAISCTVQWVGLAWSQCSATCGLGTATRKLECQRVNELGEVVYAPPLSCDQANAMKPETTQPCKAEKSCELLYQNLGCFKDSRKERAVPIFLANLRTKIVWSNLNATIHDCASIAQERGYNHFAIQFYGECWADNVADGEDSFKRHGKSTNCFLGVGGEHTNQVYKLM